MISKHVVRNDEGLIDRSREFTFYLTLTPSAYVNCDAESFTGLIGEDEVIFQKQEDNTYEASFELSDGQKLVIWSLPAGTKYTVTEIGTKNYTPSAIVTTGDRSNNSEGFNAAMNEDLMVANQVVNSDGLNKTAYTKA